MKTKILALSILCLCGFQTARAMERHSDHDGCPTAKFIKQQTIDNADPSHVDHLWDATAEFKIKNSHGVLTNWSLVVHNFKMDTNEDSQEGRAIEVARKILAETKLKNKPKKVSRPDRKELGMCVYSEIPLDDKDLPGPHNRSIVAYEEGPAEGS